MTRYLLDVQPGLVNVLAMTVGENVTRYVHEPRGIQARQNPSGDWFWTVQDGLGSVRVDVNDELVVQAARSFAPYGNEFGVQGTFETPYAFTGEMTDANGLVYLRARYYVPELGVFPSLDPVENLNRYQYVGANPINFVDLSGMIPQAPEAVCPPGWDGFLPSTYCANGDVVCLSTAWCQQGSRTVSGATAWEEYRSSYVGQAVYDEALFSLTGMRTAWWNPLDSLKKATGLALVPVAEIWNWATDQVYEHPIEAAIIVGAGITILVSVKSGPQAGIGAATNLAGGLISGRYNNLPTDKLVATVAADAVIGAGAGYLFKYAPTRATTGQFAIRTILFAGGVTTAQGLATMIENSCLGQDVSVADIICDSVYNFVLGGTLSAVHDAILPTALTTPRGREFTPAMPILYLLEKYKDDPSHPIHKIVNPTTFQRSLLWIASVLGGSNIVGPLGQPLGGNTCKDLVNALI